MPPSFISYKIRFFNLKIILFFKKENTFCMKKFVRKSNYFFSELISKLSFAPSR